MPGTAASSLLYKIEYKQEAFNVPQMQRFERMFGGRVTSLDEYRTKLLDKKIHILRPPDRAAALTGMDSYTYDDWDTEGARAIAPELLHWSEQILAKLPISVPNPDVAPAADGSLCMEWINGQDFLWADVEPGNKLNTLTKIAGEKVEMTFDLGSAEMHQYLIATFARLYP